MSIPRPKILTRVTVPTGGWAWAVDLSNVAQYDTNLTGTVPAGNYFISGDGQSDDLLYALADSIQTEIDGSAVTADFCAAIDPVSHIVEMQFWGSGVVDATGDNDVRLKLSSWDSDLCAALGHSTNDLTSTIQDNPQFYGNWHHAYGWYSDEDGQLAGLLVEDQSSAFSLQGVAIGGKVKSQFFGERFSNILELQFLERYHPRASTLTEVGGSYVDYYNWRTKVFSRGVGYGSAPVEPYNRNEPLECWWEEARKGVEFRVYRDGFIDTSRAAATGVSTASANTTLTDAGKSWDIEPYEWVGCILYVPSFAPAKHQCFYVASHNQTVLTVAAHPTGNDIDGGSGGAGGNSYYVFDHRYQTYVLDLKKMKDFTPREIPTIDRYNIKIPLLRYVA